MSWWLAPGFASRHRSGARWIASVFALRASARRNDATVGQLRAQPPPVSGITKNYFPKLRLETSRSSGNDGAEFEQHAARLLTPHLRRDTRRSFKFNRETSMSKRIALFSAVAFSALALTSTFVAPAR